MKLKVFSAKVYTMELSAWGQLIYRGSAVLCLVARLGCGLPVTALGCMALFVSGLDTGQLVEPSVQLKLVMSSFSGE